MGNSSLKKRRVAGSKGEPQKKKAKQKRKENVTRLSTAL